MLLLLLFGLETLGGVTIAAQVVEEAKEEVCERDKLPVVCLSVCICLCVAWCECRVVGMLLWLLLLLLLFVRWFVELRFGLAG